MWVGKSEGSSFWMGVLTGLKARGVQDILVACTDNLNGFTNFFQFPLEIRMIIYTTNIIENLNGKIRKYTKSKLPFPSDDAVKKTVYLSLVEIEKKWTMPIPNWGLIINQFMLIFANRIQI